MPMPNVSITGMTLTAYGADYYAEKFPGFDDLVYEILAREHKALNADPVAENPEEYQ
jgi:hypothetical protein